MFIDAEDADGIVGEDDLAEDQEVRLVFNDKILPALDRGLFGLLDFLSRAEVEPERVAQQHGTKPTFALERLEEPARVRVLSIVFIEPSDQNRKLGLIRGEARLTPIAAQLRDISVQRLGQVVQSCGEITGGHGADYAEEPETGAFQSRSHVPWRGDLGCAASLGSFRHRGVLVVASALAPRT